MDSFEVSRFCLECGRMTGHGRQAEVPRGQVDGSFTTFCLTCGRSTRTEYSGGHTFSVGSLTFTIQTCLIASSEMGGRMTFEERRKQFEQDFEQRREEIERAKAEIAKERQAAREHSSSNFLLDAMEQMAAHGFVVPLAFGPKREIIEEHPAQSGMGSFNHLANAPDPNSKPRPVMPGVYRDGEGRYFRWDGKEESSI